MPFSAANASTTNTASSLPPANSTTPYAAGYVAGAAPIDIALISLTVGLSALLLLFTTRRLVRNLAGHLAAGSAPLVPSLLTFSGGGLGFASLAFLSSLLQLTKAVVALVYTLQLWLNAPFRYVAVYGFGHGAIVLLFFLYERRLSALFALSPAAVRAAYSWTLRLMMVGYVAAVVTVTAYFGAWARNTAVGGYSSQPPPGWYVKVILYATDLAIGVTILGGTFHALVGLVRSQRRSLGAANATPLYQLILGSDCVKFAAVAAVEAYKLANASDPAAVLGNLPAGNTGFQHLIDMVKVGLMAVNLFAPMSIAERIASAPNSAVSSVASRKPVDAV
ncbi:hypothetical protein DFJ73DRAFT_772627 [Zopfochytrium polystomum]|nr:hypothetical protein DFJ73DRAFT_772627 [Zopfochytrium polystomum]